MIKLFWLILSLACIGWYVAVLGYVTIRGGVDIKEMLKQLAAAKSADDDPSQET